MELPPPHELKALIGDLTLKVWLAEGVIAQLSEQNAALATENAALKKPPSAHDMLKQEVTHDATPPAHA